MVTCASARKKIRESKNVKLAETTLRRDGGLLITDSNWQVIAYIIKVKDFSDGTLDCKVIKNLNKGDYPCLDVCMQTSLQHVNEFFCKWAFVNDVVVFNFTKALPCECAPTLEPSFWALGLYKNDMVKGSENEIWAHNYCRHEFCTFLRSIQSNTGGL